MNKDFELLLKVISKGTIDTVEEFDLFWGVSCIDYDWTQLYIFIYNEDEEEDDKLSMWPDSLVGKFCLDISEYYDDFKTEGINKLRTEYENECEDENYYEYDLEDCFISNVMDMDFIDYIKSNHFNEDEHDKFSVNFYGDDVDDIFEYLKDYEEKYLVLDDRRFLVVDKEEIKPYLQKYSIRIKDFLDNFVNND